jgi:chromosome segregation ATPase
MMAILPTDAGTLDYYIKSGEIPKDVRESLAKAAKLKQEMADLQRQVDQRKAEIDRITQEQVRIRENIKTVPDRSTLKNRLLEKLEEQEKQIDEIYKKMDEQQKAHEKARKELEDYLSNLTVGE